MNKKQCCSEVGIPFLETFEVPDTSEYQDDDDDNVDLTQSLQMHKELPWKRGISNGEVEEVDQDLYQRSIKQVELIFATWQLIYGISLSC